MSLQDEVAVPARAVIFNTGASSYFRVRYDARSLCKVVGILRENHTKIPAVERAQLLEDNAPLALPNPGCKACGIFAWFHMQDYIRIERDYAPLSTAVGHLERLRRMLNGTLLEKRFTRWMDALIQPYFDDRGYGMENENSEDQKLLKQDMVNYACWVRRHDDFSKPCREEAWTQVNAWMKSTSSKNPISPYLRRSFYAVGWTRAVKEGNSEMIDFFFRKFEEAKTVRFMHQEHFRQLKRAYEFYMREVLDIMAQNKTGEHGSRIEDVCSTIMKEQISELPETGLKVLKQCLGKQESEMLGEIEEWEKSKELEREAFSINEIEGMDRWPKKVCLKYHYWSSPGGRGRRTDGRRSEKRPKNSQQKRQSHGFQYGVVSCSKEPLESYCLNKKSRSLKGWLMPPKWMKFR